MLDLLPSIIFETLTVNLKPEQIKDFSFITGGCINHGGLLATTKGNFFVKWNDRSAYPSMFESERNGLTLLEKTKSVRVPKVNDVEECGIFQFLLLEWIESKDRSPDFWKVLGQSLARLHRHSALEFGLDHNNYIGSISQLNNWSSSWIDFFIKNRIEFQVNLLKENHPMMGRLRKKLEKLYAKLSSLLPEEKPSLIHGDLWGGNLITDENGKPCLIDPSVYYGHREMELAYTRLFDRFDNEFYRSYHENFPLAPGFEKRMDIYNLYPLLVHANLFGGSYLQQAEAIVDRFM